MNDWKHTAQSLWEAVHARVKELKAEGETLQAIADKVGVNHRSVIGEWLKGNRQAANAAMGDLLTYAERLGIDYRHYFPGGEPPAQELPDCSRCKKLMAKERELQKALKDLDRMRLDLAEARGEVKALERQLNRSIEETAKKQMVAG